MHIKIFMNTAISDYERQVLRGMYEGILKHEMPNDEKRNQELKSIAKSFGRKRKVELDYEEEYKPCDVAVFVGSWKPDRNRTWHETRTSIKRKAKTFVILETPLLGRSITDQHSYFRVGINGFLNRSAHWGEEKSYPDDRLKKLNLSFNGWQENNDPESPIVVALQLQGDASLRNNDINDWCIRTINELRKYTTRPIEIRTHPAISEKGMANHDELFKYFCFNKIDNLTFVDGKKVSWDEQLENCYCVVSYTSGLAIDAVLKGIPVIACDEGSFAYSIGERHIENINNLNLATDKDVKQWLNNLAYCQWTPEEMKSGHVWSVLKPTIEKALREVEENESN